MSHYQLYSYQHWEKGLGKYLFEDAQSSLYLWMDKRQLLHKIQFEYQEKWAFEMSATSNCTRWVSNFLNYGKVNFSTIFQRSFSEKIKGVSELPEAIRDIEIQEISNWAQIQKSMLNRSWSPFLYVSFRKSE